MIHSLPRLLADFKRRKVFRAIAFYGAGAFGLLQLADIVFPALGLPETAVTWLVVLCLVAFPVVVITAWTFDLTGHGVERTGAAGDQELEAILAQSRTQRWLAGSVGLFGIVLLTTGAWWAGMRTGEGTAAVPVSAVAQGRAVEALPIGFVAVLPFVNIGDPDDQPFSDGLSEELSNALSQVEGLRVAARTSAFAFKGRDADARTIGRELGVGAIVEGSVRRSREVVRVSVQLSRTSDGFRLWSEVLERELTAANVFAIQDELTFEIARALTRELRPDAATLLAERRTPDLEAYDLYLQGRHRWATREVDSVREAIRYYEQAIARDSSFVLAWAGLADAWGVLPFYDRTVTGDVAYPQALRAAQRALELAPDLAEANAARGIIATEYEADPVTGERYLLRAIELNPNYEPAHAWLCETLAIQGRDDDALPVCRRAVTLNPLGPIANLLVAVPLAGLGRYEEALAQVRRTLGLEPDITLARLMEAGLLLRLGRPDTAAASLEALALGEGVPGSALRAVARSYPGTDPSPTAIKAVRDLEQSTGPGLFFVAALYSWAGSTADAVRVVETAAADRNPWIGLAAVFGEYDGLREDPQFAEILRTLGLPNGNTAYRERAMARERPGI
ncbi:MAG: tetratricopeptide repeat protein [Candidatus Longimicrobiales bacterium M2_2A_002]